MTAWWVLITPFFCRWERSSEEEQKFTDILGRNSPPLTATVWSYIRWNMLQFRSHHSLSYFLSSFSLNWIFRRLIQWLRALWDPAASPAMPDFNTTVCSNSETQPLTLSIPSMLMLHGQCQMAIPWKEQLQCSFLSLSSQPITQPQGAHLLSSDLCSAVT